MRIAGRVVRPVRRVLRRAGIDVVRYPSRQREPLAAFLQQHRIETVLDIGANVGQYGQALRQFYGFGGRIISFEPDPDSFAELALVASADPRWSATQLAFGSEPGERTLRVSRLSVFNSFLAVSPSMQQRDERAATDHLVSVQVTTVDDWWDIHGPPGRVLVKLDVQGYEQQILKGARHTLDKLAGLQVEMSLSPLYEGQPLIEDMLPFLRDAGFVPYEFWNGYLDEDTGAVLELDGIFFRSSDYHVSHV